MFEEMDLRILNRVAGCKGECGVDELFAEEEQLTVGEFSIRAEYLYFKGLLETGISEDNQKTYRISPRGRQWVKDIFLRRVNDIRQVFTIEELVATLIDYMEE